MKILNINANNDNRDEIDYLYDEGYFESHLQYSDQNSKNIDSVRDKKQASDQKK